MDIKYCPQCGKEIPVEAHFCPYCMTKLIAEDGTKIPVVKKNNLKKLYIILALTLVIIIIEMIILVLLFSKDNKGSFHVNIGNSTEMTTEKENYSEYLGVWIDEEHKENQDIEQTGGRKIEICKVMGEEIIFNIESYSSSYPYYHKAYLEYIKVQLINGKGNFNFSDDGFGNSGTGEIKLSDGKIYARVELDNSYVGGQWDLSMDADFAQTEKYTVDQVIDIADCLTTYNTQKIKFGNRTDVIKYGDSISYVYENGITIDLQDLYDTEELYITEIWIDYDTLNGDYKYCYKGIDNTKNREDVKEIFKEQNVSGEELYLDDTSYYQYWSSEEGVMSQIYFNDDGYVQSIRYSML